MYVWKKATQFCFIVLHTIVLHFIVSPCLLPCHVIYTSTDYTTLYHKDRNVFQFYQLLSAFHLPFLDNVIKRMAQANAG